MTKELIALDDLKYDKYNRCDECYYGCITDKCRKYVSYEIVRQALEEKEKQDKVLEIIKNELKQNNIISKNKLQELLEM